MSLGSCGPLSAPMDPSSSSPKLLLVTTPPWLLPPSTPPWAVGTGKHWFCASGPSQPLLPENRHHRVTPLSSPVIIPVPYPVFIPSPSPCPPPKPPPALSLLFCYVTATVTKQKENIRELTATVTEQKENIRELTATVTEQKEKNRALETQQTFILEELNKKNEEISNLTLGQVELRKENRDREIAFSAGLMQSGSGHVGPFTTEITLTYRNVFTNIGNSYNPITGIFTAPLKGAYMFRISIFGVEGTTYAAIYKNGERMVIAHDIQPKDRMNSSNGVVLILEVGDVVYVRLWANSRIYDDQRNFNTFSGYLLFPLR
ncbi:uncharacterized protein LOC125244431 [Megalobrama amblycephala]|uniref:uncharacterized protein LOC125244431 n=1 Tax=Megalobrama amblycephala TaxID=75352 RepID=UPI0020144EAD|nr:uncharacterized protein LOC125244431 [Megalobrama amblycephala]